MRPSLPDASGGAIPGSRIHLLPPRVESHTAQAQLDVPKSIPTQIPGGVEVVEVEVVLEVMVNVILLGVGVGCGGIMVAARSQKIEG